MDAEVSKVESVLITCDDSQPITKVVLLQVLLRQVLQISLGERRLSRDNNLGLLTVDADLVSEVSSLVVDLDTVVQELLEDSRVEETILNRGSEVDSVSQALSLAPAGAEVLLLCWHGCLCVGRS